MQAAPRTVLRRSFSHRSHTHLNNQRVGKPLLLSRSKGQVLGEEGRGGGGHRSVGEEEGGGGTGEGSKREGNERTSTPRKAVAAQKLTRTIRNDCVSPSLEYSPILPKTVCGQMFHACFFFTRPRSERSERSLFCFRSCAAWAEVEKSTRRDYVTRFLPFLSSF